MRKLQSIPEQGILPKRLAKCRIPEHGDQWQKKGTDETTRKISSTSTFDLPLRQLPKRLATCRIPPANAKLQSMAEGILLKQLTKCLIPEHGGQWQKKGTDEMTRYVSSTSTFDLPSRHSNTETIAWQESKDEDYDDWPTEPGQVAAYLYIERRHQRLALSPRILDNRTVLICHGVSDMDQYRRVRFLHLHETSTAEGVVESKRIFEQVAKRNGVQSKIVMLKTSPHTIKTESQDVASRRSRIWSDRCL